MLKRQGFSKIFVCILLGGFLIFGLTSIGFSGGEPPAGSKTTGKAIDAVITAVLIGSPGNPPFRWVEQVLVGDCDGTFFALGPDVNTFITPNNISITTASGTNGIENQMITDVNIPGCFSGDLVVSKVINFYNTGEAIGAVVVLHRLQ